MSILDLNQLQEPFVGTNATFKKSCAKIEAKPMNECKFLFFVSSLYSQMDKKQIIPLVLVVLVLFFFLNRISVSQPATIPTTSKTTINTGSPSTTTYYASGKSNSYKAQYYN